MFHNYFFLRRLAGALHTELVGLSLSACFSQNKDELILGFANHQKECYIRASLSPEICLLQFPNEFKKANKNYIDLYEELIGLTVTHVSVFSYERSFKIIFESDLEIIFKMHGSRSNILIAQKDQVIKIFKGQLKNDLTIMPSDLNKQLILDAPHFHAVNGDLRKFLPALGKEAKKFLESLGYAQKPMADQWLMMQDLLLQLDVNPIWIYKGAPPEISLLPSDKEIFLETLDPIYAANEFYKQYTYGFYLSSEKSQAIKQIDKSIQKLRNYLDNSSKKLSEIKNRRTYEELANLIMANLHQIATGSKSVVLQDFYQGGELEVKLNKNLSPQKNAEQYYRKSKNQKKEIEILKTNIENKERDLANLLRKREQIELMEDIKSLRKEIPSKIKKQEEKPEPFIRYQFMDYEILIGRNARQNDELTLKHATKNDLWLHAKDVAGSHVVVKVHPGSSFPGPVIERAAQIAAWNSKRKTDTLCPVIYTPKKFVRKRKGDPPGAMVLEREEIIMVTPIGIE
ncbi:MAG: NFACT RNA binding domain-containing protein [Cyclobacteriaceae bacterium]